MSKFFRKEQLINTTKSLVLLLSFWEIQKERSLERNERESRILVTITSFLKKDEDSDRNRTSKKENRSWDYYDFRKLSRFFFFFFFWIWRTTIRKSRARKNRRKTWERSKRAGNLWKTWKIFWSRSKSAWKVEIMIRNVFFLTSFLIWTRSEENLNLKSLKIWENKLILLIFM
jgi:hypothetical protein